LQNIPSAIPRSACRIGNGSSGGGDGVDAGTDVRGGPRSGGGEGGADAEEMKGEERKPGRGAGGVWREESESLIL